MNEVPGNTLLLLPATKGLVSHRKPADRVLRRQPRNVWKWPISEVATPRMEVRSVGNCGLDLLTLSFSRFDPTPTLAVYCGNCFNPY